MRRIAPTLLVAGLLGLALVGCAPAAPSAAPSAPAQPSASAAQTPEAPAETAPATGAGASNADADGLCAAQSTADQADVCVLEGVNSTANLEFTKFSVVKLIGGTFSGSVSIAGSAQQVVITEADFASDLTVDPRGGAVVKLSTVGGTLNVAGGHGATLVKNTVGGDLLCANRVQANGEGNAVTGRVTGTCSRVA